MVALISPEAIKPLVGNEEAHPTKKYKKKNTLVIFILSLFNNCPKHILNVVFGIACKDSFCPIKKKKESAIALELYLIYNF